MSKAIVTQYIIEALVAFTKAAADTPTGAGVSQYIIEALLVDETPITAHVSQYIVEVLMADSGEKTEPVPGGSSGVKVFGYAT
jgi:hypothetical protein